MASLSVIGNGPDQSLRKTLAIDQPVTIGRSPRVGWAVPWEVHISREHAELTWTGRELQVRCLSSARNSLIFSGQQVRQLVLAGGEEFRIGGTRFLLDVDAASTATEEPLVEFTYSADQLQRVRFADPEVRLEHLARLPIVIAQA